jgi:hypothetical protein
MTWEIVAARQAGAVRRMPVTAAQAAPRRPVMAGRN